MHPNRKVRYSIASVIRPPKRVPTLYFPFKLKLGRAASNMSTFFTNAKLSQAFLELLVFMTENTILIIL